MHYYVILHKFLHVILMVTQVIKKGKEIQKQSREMENTAVLREWFDRVDSDKTGSITALQLKVFFFVWI